MGLSNLVSIAHWLVIQTFMVGGMKFCPKLNPLYLNNSDLKKNYSYIRIHRSDKHVKNLLHFCNIVKNGTMIQIKKKKVMRKFLKQLFLNCFSHINIFFCLCCRYATRWHKGLSYFSQSLRIWLSDRVICNTTSTLF